VNESRCRQTHLSEDNGCRLQGENERDRVQSACACDRPPWKRRFTGYLLCSLLLGHILTGCASAPLTASGALSSYSDLRPSRGMLTSARLKVDKELAMAATKVRIVPTNVSDAVTQPTLSPQQVKLVSNRIDRALCAGLSAQFEVVNPDQFADLTVHAVITHIDTTNKMAAGASTAASLGGTAASAATGLPIIVPRLPIGMGSLSVEAEAINVQHQQVAAMTWARGADLLTIKARVSEEADAYALAKEFGADFSKLLTTGADPFTKPLPSMQGVSELLGGKPKYSACAVFGPNPGLRDALGGAVGLPPDWTDSGRQND
jgi:Protein of unknown function (DUF3313)